MRAPKLVSTGAALDELHTNKHLPNNPVADEPDELRQIRARMQQEDSDFRVNDAIVQLIDGANHLLQGHEDGTPGFLRLQGNAAVAGFEDVSASLDDIIIERRTDLAGPDQSGFDRRSSLIGDLTRHRLARHAAKERRKANRNAAIAVADRTKRLAIEAAETPDAFKVLLEEGVQSLAQVAEPETAQRAFRSGVISDAISHLVDAEQPIAATTLLEQFGGDLETADRSSVMAIVEASEFWTQTAEIAEDLAAVSDGDWALARHLAGALDAPLMAAAVRAELDQRLGAEHFAWQQAAFDQIERITAISDPASSTRRISPEFWAKLPPSGRVFALEHLDSEFRPEPGAFDPRSMTPELLTVHDQQDRLGDAPSIRLDIETRDAAGNDKDDDRNEFIAGVGEGFLSMPRLAWHNLKLENGDRQAKRVQDMFDLAISNVLVPNLGEAAELAIQSAVANAERGLGRATGSALFAGGTTAIGRGALRRGRDRLPRHQRRLLDQGLLVVAFGTTVAAFSATQISYGLSALYEIDNQLLKIDKSLGDLTAEVVTVIVYSGAGGLDVDFDSASGRLTIGKRLNSPDAEITYTTHLFQDE